MGINCAKAEQPEIAEETEHRKKDHKHSTLSILDPNAIAQNKLNELKKIKGMYEQQIAIANQKVHYHGSNCQKEETIIYLRFIDLINYEIALISQKMLDLEYMIENPNQSISSSKASIFSSVIEQKYNNVDVDKLGIDSLSTLIRNDYESFVKNGNTNDEEINCKYEEMFKKAEKKRRKEISKSDFISHS